MLQPALLELLLDRRPTFLNFKQVQLVHCRNLGFFTQGWIEQGQLTVDLGEIQQGVLRCAVQQVDHKPACAGCGAGSHAPGHALAGAFDQAGISARTREVSSSRTATPRLGSRVVKGKERSWFGAGDRGQQGRFPSVGSAHDSDIGDQLELQAQATLQAGLAAFPFTGGLVGGVAK